MRVVKKFIDMLGYRKVIVKNDNEPATMALINEVKIMSDVEIVPEHPPAYDSRTSGKAENAVQRIEGQFRTLRDALETR